MLRACALRLAAGADPWATLGVQRGADDKAVKDAYHKLAKKYHPDVNKNGEEMFKKVKLAYEAISTGAATKEEARKKGPAGESRSPYSNYSPGQAERQRAWNPYEAAGARGYDPRVHKAWSQRAEYYRVQEEEERVRQKARSEMDSAARVVFIVLTAILMFPLFNALFATDEVERRRRQEEFERVRRQQMQLNAMRGQYEDPSRPPRAVGEGDSKGHGWVWVHPYGWQWLPLDKIEQSRQAMQQQQVMQQQQQQQQQRVAKQIPMYVEEEPAHHPTSPGAPTSA